MKALVVINNGSTPFYFFHITAESKKEAEKKANKIYSLIKQTLAICDEDLSNYSMIWQWE